MRGYSVAQRFLFPNFTVAAIPFVYKIREKTVLQIMNLAACAKEANECDGISTQQKQGFAALNMRRKKGKYTRHNFVLERIQLSCSISAGLIVRVVESEGMLQKRGTRNKHGERRENNKKKEQKRELEI